MAKKRLVLALGHDALGTNLPEQKTAVTKQRKPSLILFRTAGRL